MRNRIDRTFALLKANGHKALIGYMTAGFPTPKAFHRLVLSMAEAGLDMIEIGVPFSDPIADGPTIQQSSQRALRYRISPDWIFREVHAWRRGGLQIPIILMSYANPVYAMGISRFFERCSAAGVDGVIIPDIIPEEGLPYHQAARKHHVHLIYLVAPTTPPKRLRQIAAQSRGFLYTVSQTGVTGVRRSLPLHLHQFLKSVKAASRRPVAVGFGISSPAQAKRVGRTVEGVIVGSALIRAAERSKSKHFRDVLQLVRSLKGALHAS